MNNGQKVVAGMLAVAVVVLALVAFAPKPPPEPTVVAVEVGRASTDTRYHLFRVWSDGTTDVTYFHFNNAFGFECELESTCGPVELLP